MAGVSIESGKSGRKSVDSNINMVPMIDLLISVIAFLLVSAVWIATGSVRSQQPQTSNDPAPPGPTPTALLITVSPSSMAVGMTVADAHTLPGGSDGIARLHDALVAAHRADPTLREVHIQADSAVHYEQVVAVMDAVYGVWGEHLAPGQALSDTVRIEMQ